MLDLKEFLSGQKLQKATIATLRDCFALGALIGLLASAATDQLERGKLVELAYDYADRMLLQRGR